MLYYWNHRKATDYWLSDCAYGWLTMKDFAAGSLRPSVPSFSVLTDYQPLLCPVAVAAHLCWRGSVTLTPRSGGRGTVVRSHMVMKYGHVMSWLIRLCVSPVLPWPPSLCSQRWASRGGWGNLGHRGGRCAAVGGKCYFDPQFCVQILTKPAFWLERQKPVGPRGDAIQSDCANFCCQTSKDYIVPVYSVQFMRPTFYFKHLQPFII